MPEGGRLTIATGDVRLDRTRRRAAEPRRARTSLLACATPAAAWTEDVGAQIFEPFFTTKARARAPASGSRPSTGSSSQSGGAIYVDTNLGEGTCFTVCLPVAGDAP